jgi:hypothetical protein
MVLRYRIKESARDRERDAAHKVMMWVRDILALDPDTVVSVTSHNCGDPGCGDAAASILLMRPGRRTTSFQLSKSLNAVTEADVRTVLRPIIGKAPQAAARVSRRP